MNLVIASGRLTRDPQVFEKNGKKRVRIVVAAKKPYHAHKENEPDADFPDFWVFGKKAEDAAKYLVKGQKVEVRGYVSTKFKDGKFYDNRIAEEILYREKPKASSSTTTQRPDLSEPEPIPGSVIEATDLPADDILNEMEQESELLDDIPF